MDQRLLASPPSSEWRTWVRIRGVRSVLLGSSGAYRIIGISSVGQPPTQLAGPQTPGMPDGSQTISCGRCMGLWEGFSGEQGTETKPHRERAAELPRSHRRLPHKPGIEAGVLRQRSAGGRSVAGARRMRSRSMSLRRTPSRRQGSAHCCRRPVWAAAPVPALTGGRAALFWRVRLLGSGAGAGRRRQSPVPMTGDQARQAPPASPSSTARQVQERPGILNSRARRLQMSTGWPGGASTPANRT